MKITPYNPNLNQKKSFKGILNNKILLKSLETVANHGATFVAATSFLMAVGVRPAAIALSPKVDKENKQYAMTNSIASGLIKFGMVEAVAIPIENAIKKIDKNPEKFLNNQTIKNFKTSSGAITNSKDYRVMTQILKQGSGILTTFPKSMLTIALIPLIMDKLFPYKNDKSQNNYYTSIMYNEKNPNIFNEITNKQNKLAFKGAVSDKISTGIGKIIDNKSFQKFIKKADFNEANVARNMSIATDLLLTGSFIYRTNKNKKIKEERKKPLIYNNIISTGISLSLGCSIDNFIKKNSEGFIKKFTEANKNNPKLNKYIEGINILRPTLIFALIYYGILPVFSTCLADKIDKFVNSKQKI